MKYAALTLAVLALAAFSTADLKSEIKDGNTKIHHAMIKGDMKVLEAVMKAVVTKDFKHIENGQTQNFAQMFAQMKGSFAMMKVTSAKTDVMSVKEKGNGGTASEKHMMGGTMTTPDKKTHKITFTGVSNNTYVKVNGKWKMSVMSWGKSTMTMDGKTMDPSKMGG